MVRKYSNNACVVLKSMQREEVAQEACCRSTKVDIEIRSKRTHVINVMMEAIFHQTL